MNAAKVPTKSILRRELDTAYFCDCFEKPIKNNDKTALELYLEAVRHMPAWINFLMRLRNRIVGLFGLKNLGQLGDVEKTKDPVDYKVGDRVGIFSIVSITDQEVILGDADKHLSAQISVYKNLWPEHKVSVTTMVHVNNLLGRVYLFFVVPVHKIIVPAMLARMVKSIENA